MPPSSSRPGPRSIVFALAWQGGAGPVGEHVASFASWLTDRLASTGRRVVPRIALSYMELARMVTSGEADVAWLPPVVYVHLESEGEIGALVRNERDGSDTFQAALIVRTDSPIRSIDTLRGARVAWVDRWSASGHVIPRAILSARGYPPQLTFREERFYGSHEAVVHAVLSGRAEVAATFARCDDRGRVLRGGWSSVKGGERARVLATFGTIPGDVIGARAEMDPNTRRALLGALLEAGEDPEMKPALASIFGIQRFREGPTDDYDPLRAALRGDGASAAR
jgi:phosphonate transport system substrate-binding protein